jgi:hypothetical protein
LPRAPHLKKHQQAEGAFINVPFDASYEPLLVALVAGLTMLGLEPRSVLDAAPERADRLRRIKKTIAKCRYSVHDLSCRTARFNMPFELGLTLGIHHGRRSGHVWIVLDRRPHGLKAALSDLDGYDVVYTHGRSPERLLGCLNVAFSREGISLATLKSAWRKLRRLSGAMQPLSPHGFRKLTYAAAEIAEREMKRLRHR